MQYGCNLRERKNKMQRTEVHGKTVKITSNRYKAASDRRVFVGRFPSYDEVLYHLVCKAERLAPDLF